MSTDAARAPVPDLAAFLSARLDEDEAVAVVTIRERETGLWAAHDTEPLGVWRVEELKAGWGKYVIWATGAFGGGGAIGDRRKPLLDHIARQDPARVLADVAAKRAVVARCVKVLDWWDAVGHDGDVAMPDFALATLLALAQPYADHPDFDPSWKLDQ